MDLSKRTLIASCDGVMHEADDTYSIEHTENKIITHSGLFENEIGPGVLQSREQSACLLRECQWHKALEVTTFPFCHCFQEFLKDDACWKLD